MKKLPASLLRCTVMFMLMGFFLLPQESARAQSMDNLILDLGIEELARDYLRPMVDAVGYGITSGYAHSAKVDTAFHVWVGMKGMITYIPDSDRSFVGKLPGELTALGYPTEITTATIIGGEGAVLRSTMQDQPEIVLPDGTDLQRSVFLMPQISIGPVLGTDIILRGLPAVNYQTEIGDVSFYGIALKHEVTHYFDSPVDIAVVAGYQSFSLTDLIDGQSLSGMLLIGRDLGIASVFGSLAYEDYGIDVSYTPEVAGVPAERITLDFKRRNLRFTVGGVLTLLPLIDISGEYSFGEMDNLTLGIGLSI